METRIATDKDISEIVALLKISLGESLMPKSEVYWRWKHVDNPFGKSPVLLSFDGDKLIGVRAFMRWKWQMGPETLEAVRAVDTATHPDYQGKGIFKKLTLTLLDQCASDGFKFVFNTPNSKSKPGYLKMGWQEAGKMPLHFRILRPLKMILNAMRRPVGNKSPDLDRNRLKEYLSHPSLQTLLSKAVLSERGFHSVHTAQSLQWRYMEVPNVKYDAIGVMENDVMEGLLLYRLKPSRLGLEFRITDFFCATEEARRKLSLEILKRTRFHQADFITSSGMDFPVAGTGLLALRNLKIGPIVTVRSIQGISLEPFRNFNQWQPSLGDLELF